jgi:hypothetical protein
MIKNQDAAAIERILADEYTYTNERGKVKNKAEDLADYKTKPAKFEIFDSHRPESARHRQQCRR